jgi:hypothetical protein
MKNRTFEDHMEQTNLLKPDAAAAYVYGLVKFDHVSLSEFEKLLPLIATECGCEVCGGKEGGTPGNENVVDGMVICDYCDAKRDKAANTIYFLWDVPERAFFAKHKFAEVRIKNCVQSTRMLIVLLDTQDLTINDVRCRGLVELPFTQYIWDGFVSCEEMM